MAKPSFPMHSQRTAGTCDAPPRTRRLRCHAQRVTDLDDKREKAEAKPDGNPCTHIDCYAHTAADGYSDPTVTPTANCRPPAYSYAARPAVQPRRANADSDRDGNSHTQADCYSDPNSSLRQPSPIPTATPAPLWGTNATTGRSSTRSGSGATILKAIEQVVILDMTLLAACSRRAGVGINGSTGIKAVFDTGTVSAGGFKLAFGRAPSTYFKPVDAGTSSYRELYWRLYLRNQAGWIGGGGDKLSRAVVMANSTWAEAAFGHVWSGGDYLGLDPASGTDTAGNLLTTGYNDFPHMRWLGWTPSTTPIFDSAHVGQWHYIEAHMKLNDAGNNNGVFELWIDGNLEAQETSLNWLGSYNAYGINTLFIENFWNDGSPQRQERYIDNLVVATQPIGPAAVSTPTPTPSLTPTRTPTPSATPTATATATPRPTATPIPTATPSPTPRPTTTSTPMPTVTSSPTPRPTATPTATPRPTVTPTPGPGASYYVSPKSTSGSGTVDNPFGLPDLLKSDHSPGKALHNSSTRGHAFLQSGRLSPHRRIR